MEEVIKKQARELKIEDNEDVEDIDANAIEDEEENKVASKRNFDW